MKIISDVIKNYQLTHGWKPCFIGINYIIHVLMLNIRLNWDSVEIWLQTEREYYNFTCMNVCKFGMCDSPAQMHLRSKKRWLSLKKLTKLHQLPLILPSQLIFWQTPFFSLHVKKKFNKILNMYFIIETYLSRPKTHARWNWFR